MQIVIYMKFGDIKLLDENKQHTTHATSNLALGLMESWICICYDLANPKNGLNLVPNPL
ncbi:hypothetical protein IWX80_002786 [Flavobacterium sp. CAN_S2]